MNPVFVSGGVSLVAALILVPVAMVFARRIGAIVTPNRERWSERTVPTIGGLGILAAIVAGWLVAPLSDIDRIILLVAVVAASGLGLADDLGSVSPRARLAVQASIGLALGLSIGRTLGPGAVAMGAAGAIAVVVLANATNLVDNADGLAGTLSTVAGLTLAGIAAAASLSGAAPALGLAIAGAGFGFLVYNRPAARVFMGDCGSLMLGTALAAVGLVAFRDALAQGVDPWPLLLALPVAVALQAGDVALVVVSRIRRGAPPMRGGVDHTSHRLLRAGLGPWRMLAAIALPAALFGSAVVLAVGTGQPIVVGLVTTVVIVLVLFGETALGMRVPFDAPPAADDDGRSAATRVGPPGGPPDPGRLLAAAMQDER